MCALSCVIRVVMQMG